jgi:hypothetical protein
MELNNRGSTDLLHLPMNQTNIRLFRQPDLTALLEAYRQLSNEEKANLLGRMKALINKQNSGMYGSGYRES